MEGDTTPTHNDYIFHIEQPRLAAGDEELKAILLTLR